MSDINDLKTWNLEQLKLLKPFVSGLIINPQKLSTISGSQVSSNELGARLSSIRRFKIDGRSLIEPAGRTDNGLRWKLNESVVSRTDLAKVLEDIGI